MMSYVAFLSLMVPSVALQPFGPSAHLLQDQGLPRIGTASVYDLDYARPTGLSIEEAASRGLLIGDGPSAWESADPCREFANTGNLVWALGARMLLGNSSELSMGPENWPNDDSLSAIFIATGPSLHGNVGKPKLIEDTTRCSDFATEAFAKVEKPTIIVGMGISEYDGELDFKCMDVIDERNKKELGNIQDRITTIGGFVGLRGKCSESVLRQHGYSGFEAIGCPSLFINTNPLLGDVLQTKYNDLPHKASISPADLKVAVAMPSDHDERVVPFLAKVLHFFPNSILINQNDKGDSLFSDACNALSIERPARESLMYYDALEWRQKLSEMDLVVSARIHGGMLGIAAQTPTVVIPVDMRVLEMVEAMQVPHIMPAELPDDVQDFVADASSKFDGRAFDEQRRTYAARYKELFSKLGLTLNPDLSRL